MTPRLVRLLVEDLLSQHPELFPKAMTQGFTLCGKLPLVPETRRGLSPPGPGHRDR